MYLNSQQKIKSIVATFFFLILYGYFRPFFVNTELKTKEIVINSLLFFIWIGYSYAISNTFIETSRTDSSIALL